MLYKFLNIIKNYTKLSIVWYFKIVLVVSSPENCQWSWKFEFMCGLKTKPVIIIEGIELTFISKVFIKYTVMCVV